MRVTSVTGSAGFTLLELLVVLAIMVMIAAAWPLASARVFAAQHLRDESQVLAAAVRLGQMTARMTGTPQELRISMAGRSWRLSSQSRELPQGITLGIRGGPNERFILFPDGGSTGQALDMSFEQRVATVRVSPIAGHVEVAP